MTEILSPYYRTDGTVVGDWIDLNDFEDHPYNPDFLPLGIEADVSGDIIVCNFPAISNKKYLFSNTNPAVAIRIGNFPYMAAYFDYATIYMCDLAGNVVGSQAWTRALGPSQPNVWFPSTGEDFYLIIASDTGKCDFIKDKQTPPVLEVDDTFAVYREFGGETKVIRNRINVDGVLTVLDNFLLADLVSTQIFFPTVSPPIDTGGGSGLTIGVPGRMFSVTDNRWFVATDNRKFTA